MQNSASNTTSLTQMARSMFAQCKPVIRRLPDDKVSEVQAWEQSYAVVPEKSASDVMSRAYARWLQSTRGSDQAKKIGLRELSAACLMVANIVEGRQEMSVDALLTEADREARMILTDAEALQAVEECGRKTQEAEKQAKELITAKEAVELSLLQLQDVNKALEAEKLKLIAENQQLRTEKEAQVTLSDSKAQMATSTSKDPVVNDVILELRKFKVELTKEWIDSNRARVQERYSATDQVTQVMRMIQEDSSVMLAITKSPLVGPAFKLVEMTLPTIAG